MTLTEILKSCHSNGLTVVIVPVEDGIVCELSKDDGERKISQHFKSRLDQLAYVPYNMQRMVVDILEAAAKKPPTP